MSEIIEDSLDSRLLNKRIRYRAILPDGYENSSGKKYPVLYLLHGLFGSCDNFPDLTRISEYAEGTELVVIFPEGENGWYSDGQEFADNKFESYFWHELFPAIDSRYRVIRERTGRAVAGISMGGYGAFKMVFRQPAQFVFAASMSGAFDAATRMPLDSAQDWLVLGESLTSVFGEQRKRKNISRDDLFRLIENAPVSTIGDLPQLYFDCGTEDSFIKTNRELAELLKSKKILFEYCEIEGGAHDWEYWNRQLAVVVKKATDALRIYCQNG